MYNLIGKLDKKYAGSFSLMLEAMFDCSNKIGEQIYLF